MKEARQWKLLLADVTFSRYLFANYKVRLWI